MRRKLVDQWRIWWTRIAGPSALGKVAARLAAWRTVRYRRITLASYHSKGFVTSTAVLAHPDVCFGANVFIGDNVVMSSVGKPGPVLLGDRVHIYGDTLIETGSGGSIAIGRDTHLQPGCHIHAFLSSITIGENVEIAAQCAFYSYNHGIALGQVIMGQPITSAGPIVVGDGAWLGHAVIVLADVNIGAGAVIGAGSVVTRDIPANAIAAGNPARVIKYRI
jgi:acetyltransferase-like isoleucine patch superfamily enzyme